ncbi:MAG: hydrogenase maturation nickel metallochaperone HypA [Dehalococcoidia bacterium]|nr:hydrogenase maturation nickel metallochaperone HypA [Dehalococcoidia bacterium]
MHELTITQNILNVALEHARGAGAKKVGRINLVIGEMTGIVSESVQFYFNFIKEGTLAEEASLFFNIVPARFRCRACGTPFELKTDTSCPHCKASDMEVLSGRELFVESIEVD